MGVREVSLSEEECKRQPELPPPSENHAKKSMDIWRDHWDSFAVG